MAPDSGSWSVFWPRRHLPGRAARAVPTQCQACSQPALIDLVSSCLSCHTFIYPDSGRHLSLLLPGHICLWTAHRLQLGIDKGHPGGDGSKGRVRGYPPNQVRNSKPKWPSQGHLGLVLCSKGPQPGVLCYQGRWLGSGPEGSLSPPLLLAPPPQDLGLGGGWGGGPFSYKGSGLFQIKGSRWASAGSSFLCLSGLVKYLKCQGPWEPA